MHWRPGRSLPSPHRGCTEGPWWLECVRPGPLMAAGAWELYDSRPFTPGPSSPSQAIAVHFGVMSLVFCVRTAKDIRTQSRDTEHFPDSRTRHLRTQLCRHFPSSAAVLPLYLCTPAVPYLLLCSAPAYTDSDVTSTNLYTISCLAGTAGSGRHRGCWRRCVHDKGTLALGEHEAALPETSSSCKKAHPLQGQLWTCPPHWERSRQVSNGR